jgi:hypothetical protein
MTQPKRKKIVKETFHVSGNAIVVPGHAGSKENISAT